MTTRDQSSVLTRCNAERVFLASVFATHCMAGTEGGLIKQNQLMFATIFFHLTISVSGYHL
jgi:hypothetical protein